MGLCSSTSSARATARWAMLWSTLEKTLVAASSTLPTASCPFRWGCTAWPCMGWHPLSASHSQTCKQLLLHDASMCCALFLFLQLTGSFRPEFRMPDRLSGNSEEVRKAFESYHAYFGRYHVEIDSVLHHIEVSGSFQSCTYDTYVWVGKGLVLPRPICPPRTLCADSAFRCAPCMPALSRAAPSPTWWVRASGGTMSSHVGHLPLRRMTRNKLQHQLPPAVHPATAGLPRAAQRDQQATAWSAGRPLRKTPLITWCSRQRL